MKISLAVLGIVLTSLVVARAELVEFSYSPLNCECKARVDSSKLDPAAVANAFALDIVCLPDFLPGPDPLVPDGKDIGSEAFRQRKITLGAAIDARITKVTNLKLPVGPAWAHAREACLRQIRLMKHMQLASLSYLADGKIAPLQAAFEGSPVPEKCMAHARALENINTVGPALRKLALELCPRNGAPQRCVAKFETRARDPFLAKTNLLGFGWHNCVNDHWSQPTQTEERSAAEATLKKQLKDDRCVCDGDE